MFLRTTRPGWNTQTRVENSRGKKGQRLEVTGDTTGRREGWNPDTLRGGTENERLTLPVTGYPRRNFLEGTGRRELNLVG